MGWIVTPQNPLLVTKSKRVEEKFFLFYAGYNKIKYNPIYLCIVILFLALAKEDSVTEWMKTNSYYYFPPGIFVSLSVDFVLFHDILNSENNLII